MPSMQEGDGMYTDSLLSPAAALAISGGISDSTRRRLIAAGEYPAPVVLSRDRHGKPVRIAWSEHDVRAWVARKIEASRTAPAGAPGHATA
jgi:predicted DNA-binding transcriptional regulator AlpA